MNTFLELETSAAQIGYHFDALMRLEDGYLVVLEDTIGATLEFKGATPQAAVESAISGLSMQTERLNP